MTHNRSTRRHGFTLLEVLLASALAVVLMAALYVALDVQLRLASAGRESIEAATLSRAITSRLENDLAAGLGPVAPPVDSAAKGSGGSSGPGMGGMGGSASSAGSGAGAPGGSGGSGAAAGGSGGMTGASGSADAGDDMGAAVVGAGSQAIPFQAGVIGTSEQLTIYAARVAGIGKDLDETGEGGNPADARRITYWMAGTGLARQERPWLTSAQLQNSTDPDFDDGKDESSYVIAEEVTRVQFEYWDGSAWQESWDGRTTNADGQTLRGPPMAIRVHFWLKTPGPNPGETVEKEYRHTIAIRAAAGPATVDTGSTTATP